MLKNIPINEATPDQLREFANHTLGLSLPSHTKEETIRARISQAHDKDYITINIADPGLPPVQPPASQQTPAPKVPTVQGRAMRGNSSKGDPLVLLTISEQPGPGGKRDVFVGNNGVGMCIPRGRPVDVPYRYYLVLKDAVKTDFDQDATTHEILSSNGMSYPFQVNRMPPQHEIDAWNATQGISVAA